MTSHPSERSCPGCAFLSQQPGERQIQASWPRIAELLRCNDSPLDGELSEFQLFRVQSPSILTDIDAKLTQAQDMLERFQRARRNVEACLHVSKLLAHPIRRIPTELLSKIFLYCLPTWLERFGGVNEYDSMHPNYPPWTLSQVCRRWRRLSLSLPELWSRFNLVLRLHKNRITPQQCVYKTYLHMERSGNYPLSLYLSSASRTNCLAIHPVVAVLQASSSRWQHLRFNMFIADLASFEGHPFPLLEAIVVQRLYDTGIVKAFQSAPKLRFVFSEPGTQALKAVTVPYPNLIYGEFTDDLSPQSLARLRKMTGLHELSLNLEPSQRSEVEGKDIVLPRLLSLDIADSDGAEHSLLASFLGRLKTPALSELSVTYNHPIMLFPAVPPATESLTTLTIHGDMGLHRNNTRNLLLFLSRVSTVNSLKVASKYITSEFVVGLTLVSKRESLLPRLRSLDISECDMPAKTVPAKLFWAMFESRLPRAQGTPTPGAVLEKISVPQWLDNVDDERWSAICKQFVECEI